MLRGAAVERPILDQWRDALDHLTHTRSQPQAHHARQRLADSSSYTQTRKDYWWSLEFFSLADDDAFLIGDDHDYPSSFLLPRWTNDEPFARAAGSLPKRRGTTTGSLVRENSMYLYL